MSHDFDELNQLTSVKYKRLMYGEWVGPTKQEQNLEDAAQEYFTLCADGWDDRKARARVCAKFALTDQDLHEAIKAHNRRPQ